MSADETAVWCEICRDSHATQLVDHPTYGLICVCDRCGNEHGDRTEAVA